MSLKALDQSNSMLILHGVALRNPTSSPTFLAVAAIIHNEDTLATLKRLQVPPYFLLKLDFAVSSWYCIFCDKLVVQTDKESFQAFGVFAKFLNMVPNGPLYAKHSGLDVIVLPNQVIDILWTVRHV